MDIRLVFTREYKISIEENFGATMQVHIALCSIILTRSQSVLINANTTRTCRNFYRFSEPKIFYSDVSAFRNFTKAFNLIVRTIFVDLENAPPTHPGKRINSSVRRSVESRVRNRPYRKKRGNLPELYRTRGIKFYRSVSKSILR